MLSTILLKPVLQGRCRAPYHLNLSQVVKSQSNHTRLVIDVLAELGVCMTDSERHNRKMVHVRSREDNNLLPPGLFLIAFASNNNDVKPTMNIRPGKSYVTFIGAIAVGISPNQAPLPRLAGRENVLSTKEVTVDMVVNGLRHDEIDMSLMEAS